MEEKVICPVQLFSISGNTASMMGKVPILIMCVLRSTNSSSMIFKLATNEHNVSYTRVAIDSLLNPVNEDNVTEEFSVEGGRGGIN